MTKKFYAWESNSSVYQGSTNAVLHVFKSKKERDAALESDDYPVYLEKMGANDPTVKAMMDSVRQSGGIVPTAAGGTRMKFHGFETSYDEEFGFTSLEEKI